jgi:LL-diaminopimelate aminotransferase
LKVQFSKRLKRLPPYVFAELEKTIAEKKRNGIDLISLSIGDPDLPPPTFILEAIQKESSDPNNHKYSLSQGEPEFRDAVSQWYHRRFNVELDPNKEVIALIGSKEGIANVSRAFVNPGDEVLVPNPSYPVYANGGTILNDGVPTSFSITKDNDFKPDLEMLKEKRAKIIYLNYPNNPTSAVIDKSTLKAIVEIATDKETIICYDNAYSEISFDNYDAPSILQVEGARELAIEFHSCSKTFNMTGDRIGFAVGNREIIEGLMKIKSQIDSGPPVYIQKVAALALESYTDGRAPSCVEKSRRIYAERRDLLYGMLESMGLYSNKPLATFYIWAKCESRSSDFASRLLDQGVVVTPGIGFGEYGEGYVRFALTQSKERITEACKRISKALKD